MLSINIQHRYKIKSILVEVMRTIPLTLSLIKNLFLFKKRFRK